MLSPSQILETRRLACAHRKFGAVFVGEHDERKTQLQHQRQLRVIAAQIVRESGRVGGTEAEEGRHQRAIAVIENLFSYNCEF